MKLISIVIPAYNEEENIPVLLQRIADVLNPLPYQYEVIVVDDGGKDGTLATVKKMAQHNKHLFYIEFSRNFGHQAALKAGLDSAKGDCVISLDADMQHPPEMFVEMIVKWEEGYDIVYTRRQEDKKLPLAKRILKICFS